jgi:hypothetical protein
MAVKIFESFSFEIRWIIYIPVLCDEIWPGRKQSIEFQFIQILNIRRAISERTDFISYRPARRAIGDFTKTVSIRHGFAWCLVREICFTDRETNLLRTGRVPRWAVRPFRAEKRGQTPA